MPTLFNVPAATRPRLVVSESVGPPDLLTRGCLHQGSRTSSSAAVYSAHPGDSQPAPRCLFCKQLPSAAMPAPSPACRDCRNPSQPHQSPRHSPCTPVHIEQPTSPIAFNSLPCHTSRQLFLRVQNRSSSSRPPKLGPPTYCSNLVPARILMTTDPVTLHISRPLEKLKLRDRLSLCPGANAPSRPP